MTADTSLHGLIASRLEQEAPLGDGWSEADVLRNYPNITHEDIAACLRYAGEILRAEKVYPLTTV